MADSPTFKRMLKEIHAERLLIPTVVASLSNPTFGGFKVPVEGWTPRPYDGYFHPSTHATWTVRQLYYYLTAPHLIEEEQPSLLFVLAVTQGKFWHEFIQRLLADAGRLRTNPGTTKRDPIVKRVEVSVLDEEFHRKGHADGRIDDDELFEFKTMSDRKIGKIKTWEDIRDTEPGYYAQTQDYLDALRAKRMRYFVMSLASPFPMTEVVVPADAVFQAAQRAKYSEALQAAADQRVPEACCAIRSAQARACPVRLACPIGQLS